MALDDWNDLKQRYAKVQAKFNGSMLGSQEEKIIAKVCSNGFERALVRSHWDPMMTAIPQAYDDGVQQWAAPFENAPAQTAMLPLLKAAVEAMEALHGKP